MKRLFARIRRKFEPELRYISYMTNVNNKWSPKYTPTPHCNGDQDPILNNPDVYRELHKYTNVLERNRGKYQYAISTVSVVRYHYQYWFRWTRVVQYIHVHFNIHMGSGANSWRGGVRNTVFKPKRGESITDTIERMQKEYQFK